MNHDAIYQEGRKAGEVGGRGQVTAVKTKKSAVGVFGLKFRWDYPVETLSRWLGERVWNVEERSAPDS